MCVFAKSISYDIIFLDYKSHPCIRKCKDGAPPMTCRYAFVLELYHTMSKACHNCPLNITDCSRPHCVAGDGAPRPILTANRMVPGPAIHVSTYLCLLHYIQITLSLKFVKSKIMKSSMKLNCNIYSKPWIIHMTKIV